MISDVLAPALVIRSWIDQAPGWVIVWIVRRLAYWLWRLRGRPIVVGWVTSPHKAAGRQMQVVGYIVVDGQFGLYSGPCRVKRNGALVVKPRGIEWAPLDRTRED